ncbi:alpha/beta fold hydrolase [Pseudohalocynthiibacter sp. F2068]|jgi:esterase|uniref:alpha/beta fold hydrolase n=1 Tax=Pseudohalocynthiibacter sp. F2068 TaxID=2926418 RepID=UPI001FF59FEF|nr:alpha/beta fold hydrolase [Pseudohalocynthiibacter sp. F2068]MCK0104527.1 alpha/beta fold hydrolase [Pseudohalocynthiibacter sp. F2068]
MLNTIVTGSETDKPKLLIAHGLYGSARNWGVIAKRMSEGRQVLSVDMRNHGLSPWFKTQSYHDMADDLAEVIESHGAPMDVVGHSMGGKASMILALKYPYLINKLIVADISPVAYSHTQIQYIKPMRDLDLERVEKRSDADQMLAEQIPEAGIRAFLLQSLDIKEKKWRLNLNTLETEMPKIIGFPEITVAFLGVTLFLSGAESDYVRPEYRPQIKALFPNAKFAKIPGAGHWLHADKPREFEAAMQAFLA